MEQMRERVARAIAPFLEGGREFDKMPVNRLQLREWARQAMCGFNDATQDDAYEAADALQPEIDRRVAEEKAALLTEIAAKLAKATLDDMERHMSNKDDVVGLVEPSDWERSQWLQATEAYVCGLEDALTTLSAENEMLEAALREVFLDGHGEGWRGNQTRRDVQHVDAEKSWSLYVSNGALSKTIARQALAGDTNHG